MDNFEIDRALKTFEIKIKSEDYYGVYESDSLQFNRYGT